MIELIQFRHSPYNEKVRWALDRKRVPHARRSVLPGPHMLTVRPLTGRTHTPVLLAEGRAIDGSAAILDWLEERFPTPALLPAGGPERAEARRIERWFDEDLTPRIRRVVLEVLLRETWQFARVFGEALTPFQLRLYGLVLPLAAPVVRRKNGIRGPESLEDGHRAIAEALDFVAARAAGGGFLVGDALSIADVTVAATLAALLGAPRSPMEFQAPIAPQHQAVIDRYAGHPAAAWMEGIYARERGASADFEGPAPV